MSLVNEIVARARGGQPDRPFERLRQRLVHALDDSTVSNSFLGKRSAPSIYRIVRLCEDERSAAEWRRRFDESASRLQDELREAAAARTISLPGPVQLSLETLTPDEVTAERLVQLGATLPGLDGEASLEKLAIEREFILPVYPPKLDITTDPPGADVRLGGEAVGVTPVSIPVGRGRVGLLLRLPGYETLQEEVDLDVPFGQTSIKISRTLQREAPKGKLKIVTYPPDCEVSIAGEARRSPTTWRLDAGKVTLRICREEFETVEREFDLKEERKGQREEQELHVKLNYNGPKADEVVGTIAVRYVNPAKVGERRPDPDPPPVNPLGRWMQEEKGLDFEFPHTPDAGADWSSVPTRDLRRGIYLIGRPDSRAPIQPDIKLEDPANSVSRGCHAWIWIYDDRSTGAAFLTFLIGSESSSGVVVGNQHVMETRALPEEATVQIGDFELRFTRTSLAPKIDFAF